MGKFQAPGRMSGRTYNFNIRGDSPTEVERGRIAQYIGQQEGIFAQQYQAEIGKPLAAPDDGSAIGRSWKRGKASAYSTFGSALQYAGSGTGLESLRDLGASMRQSGDTEGFLEELRQPAQTDWRDVKDLSSFGTYLGEQIGQTAPITGAVIAGGIAAGAAAALAPEASVLGALGTAGASLLGGTAVGTPFAFGSNVQRQEAEVKAGRRAAVDPGAALAAAVGQSALDAISDRITLIGSGLLKPAKNIFVRGLVGAGEGAAAEGLTEIGQQILERKQAGLSLTSDEAIQEYLDAGVAGGLIGGTLRGPTSLFQRRAAEDDTPPAVTPPATPPAVTADQYQTQSELPFYTNPQVQEGQEQGDLFAPPAPKTLQTKEEEYAALMAAKLDAAVSASNTAETEATAAAAEAEAAKGTPAAATAAKKAKQKSIVARQKMAAVRTLASRMPNNSAPPAPQVEEVQQELFPVEDAQKKVEEAAATVNATTTQADPALKAAAKKALKDAQAEAKKAQEAAKAAVGEPIAPPSSDETVTAARDLVRAENKASVTFLKNKLGISYPIAQKVMAQLEAEGVVSPANAVGKRTISAAPVKTSVEQAIAETAAANEVQNGEAVNPEAIGTSTENVGLGTENVGVEPDAIESAADTPQAIDTGLGTPADGTDGSTEPEGKQPRTLAAEKAADMAERYRKTYGMEFTPAQLQELEDYYTAEIERANANPSGAPKVNWDEFAPKASDTEEVTSQTPLVDLAPRQVAEVAKNLKAQFPNLVPEAPAATAPAAGETRYLPESALPRAPNTFDPTAQNAEATGERTTVTKLPSYSDLRDLQIALAERPSVEAAAAHQAVKDAFWTRTNEIDAPLNEMIIDVQANEDKQKALPEITTAEDSRKILALLNKNKNQLKTGSVEARNAVSYFSRFMRPIDAILHMVETAGNKKAKLYSKITENGIDVNPAETEFSRGHGYETATNALKWAAENLESWPKIQAMIDIRAGQPRASAGRVMSSVDRIKRLAESLDELELAKNKQFADENIDEERDIREAQQALAAANAKPSIPLGAGFVEGVKIKNPVTLTAERDAQLIEEIDARNAERKLIEATLSEDDRRFMEEQRRLDDLDRERIANNVLKEEERAAKRRAKTLEDQFKTAQEQRDKMAQDMGIIPRMSEIALMLGQRLMSVTENLLSNNNLRSAMYSIAETASEPRLAKLAMKMRGLVKETKVRMVDTLSSPDGRTMAAAYDPATDTILFNRGSPYALTNVTVLHEVAHAITHKALNNPSLPITQQLTRLFEDAQKAIGPDTTGMNNIHEFVAEAFTNKMFRDMLQASYPNGGKFSAWARFKNAVGNFIRRVFGAPAKVLGSPMDDLDMHLDQLLDTSSDATGPRPDPGQGLLYRASNSPDELTGAMARMFREEQKFGEPTKSFRDNWANRAMELYTNSKGLLSKGVLGFSSLLQLADTANAAKITDAYDLYDAVTRLEASTIASDSEVQAALIRMQEWAKKSPEKRSLLNKIVAFSTINQVDPEKTRDVYTQYWLKYDPTGEFKDGVKYTGFKTAAERDAKLKELRDRYGKDKAKSAGNANMDKAALHDEMQASWKALGPDGHAIYNLMRLTYRKQFMAMRDAVGGKIDFALGANSNLAKSIKSNIYERFFDFRSLEPYFPLVRKGEYWLAYDVLDPVTGEEEEVKEAFETRAERDRVRSLLATEVPGILMGPDGKPGVRMYENSGLERSRIGAPETKFVRDVLSALVANKVSEKAQNEISELFIDALPETSFARAIKGRSGVRGFESDALEAFRLKAFTLGRQAARYPFIQKVQEIRDKIAAQGIGATDTLHWLKYDPTGKFAGQEKFESFRTAKGADDALKALQKKYGANNAKYSGTNTISKSPAYMALIKELVMRAENAMHPPQGAWQEVAKAANQFAFTYTLGLNISSALVNLSAVPIVMIPYLSGKYGLANTTRATRAAYKLFLNSGFNTNLTTATNDVVNVKATPSIDNYFELKDVNGTGKMEYVLRTDLNLSEAQKKQMQDMLPLVKLAAAQGLLSRSLTYDTLGLESFGQNKTMLDKLSMLQGLPFHMVERSNRQVSLMASYQMELERLRKNPTEAEKSLTDAQKQDKAAEAAAYMTAEMHGTHTLSTAPRYAQSGLGRIAMMFKSYGLNIAYMQFKMLKQGCENLFPGKDAAARTLRNTAFKQLLGLQLSTALIAGVSGVPLYGLYRMVANMFLGDDDEDADMLTRKALGEWAFRGPLTQALGIDISSRTGLNDLLFRANPYANKQSNADFLAALIGGPAWSTGNQFLGGLAEMKRAALGQGGNFERGLENMLPPLPKNILKDIRFATEGARTRRNDPVLSELSPGQLMWQITGFKPAELAQREEVTRGIARMDKAVAQEKTLLLNRLNLAKSQGDRNEAAAVQGDIRAYNEKVRAKFPKMQITADTIESSGKSFERVSTRTHNGVTFNPATESYFSTLLRAYGAE